MAPGFNDQIIEEFRANEGKVASFAFPLLLLRTRGAKSDIERVNPLAFQKLEGGTMAVFASKGGAPTNPDWFHNVRANPRVMVEVGPETFEAVARIPEGDERHRIWETQKQRAPGFAEYEKATTRQIPVVILERADAA